MNTRSDSLFERVIRAITRGSVPIDGSQCDGPCAVHGPFDATKLPSDSETDRRSPIRWLSLR